MIKNKSTYIDVLIEFTNRDGRKVSRNLKFVNHGVTQFFNNQHNLVELTTGAISFYMYACEKMDWKNEIMLDIGFKNQYVEFISKVTSKKDFRDVRSLDKYIRKLKELGLILSIDSPHSAFYLVNPKYMYRGTEPGRKKLLKSIIERRMNQGESLHGLLDSTEDEFFSSAK